MEKDKKEGVRGFWLKRERERDFVFSEKERKGEREREGVRKDVTERCFGLRERMRQRE
jgi:hypothetical protein